jgi:hypothetical protein
LVKYPVQPQFNIKSFLYLSSKGKGRGTQIRIGKLRSKGPGLSGGEKGY